MRRRRLRGINDHAVRLVDRADGFRTLLQHALDVQVTLPVIVMRHHWL